MQGFHTKSEAANILGVSTRTVGNYIQNGKIRKIYNQGRVYIPQEDIEALYMSKTQDLAPSREEFSQLKEDVKRLERAVELLKSGLGFGARKPQKTEADLLMFRHTIMNELSRPGWSSQKDDGNSR